MQLQKASASAAGASEDHGPVRGAGPVNVRLAQPGDEAGILRVTNAAYEVESYFLTSSRLDAARLDALLTQGVFLVAGGISGCVYVELHGDRGYFGPLSVDPACQGAGLGKALVRAAEDYARANGCRFMDITIVNLRTELPAFYAKLGYTGTETKPFPDQHRLKLPCHLICMSKPL